MSSHDEKPAAGEFEFIVGPAGPAGTPIIDKHSGTPVAVVLDTQHAEAISALFAGAPGLLYGLGRARDHIRKTAAPDDSEAHALRRLLRAISETATPNRDAPPSVDRSSDHGAHVCPVPSLRTLCRRLARRAR